MSDSEVRKDSWENLDETEINEDEEESQSFDHYNRV